LSALAQLFLELQLLNRLSEASQLLLDQQKQFYRSQI
jgi:hypothetical protein